MRYKRQLSMGVLLIIAVLCASNWLVAQQPINQLKETDTKAKVILEKLRKKYEDYHTVNAKFQLTMEIPEQTKNPSYKGSLLQKGKKYVLDMPNEVFYCDGKTTWLYKKKKNQVQINTVDDTSDDTMLSPQQLLRIYEWKDFAYALGDTETEQGKVLQTIEFKPLKKDAEYFKIKLWVDTKRNDIVRIKAFGKDGSRYTVALQTIANDKSVKEDSFTFIASKYPNVKVEDLRID